MSCRRLAEYTEERIGRLGVYLVVATVVFAMGVGATHATITSMNAERISGGEATVEAADLEVQESYTVNYDGLTVTSVELTIENTDANAAHEGDVTVRAMHGGSEITSTQKTVSVNGGGAQSVTLAIGERIDSVDRIEVRIEQTS